MCTKRKPLLFCLALLLSSLSALSFASDYYVIVPLPGKAKLLADMAVTLNPAALPTGSVGTAYSYDFRSKLTVTGDPAYDPSKVTWSVSGTLPAGLSFSAGVLSGLPSSAVSNQSFQVSATYRTKSSTQTYSVSVTDPTPTGYWVFNIAAADSIGQGPGSVSISSLGYSSACPGTVASGSISAPSYSYSLLLNSYELFPAYAQKICIPASLSDIKPIAKPASTWLVLNGSWLLINGAGVAVTAGGKNWVVLGITSGDSGGVYPARAARRFVAAQVPSFQGSIQSMVQLKYNQAAYLFNYSVTP